MPERSILETIIKSLNYICAGVMLMTSLIRFQLYYLDSSTVFMDGFYLAFTAYLGVFAALLASAEYQYVNILKYIEFLITQTGKGVFLIFVGVLLFDNRRKVDLWASITLTLVGIFNLMLSCVKK